MKVSHFVLFLFLHWIRYYTLRWWYNNIAEYTARNGSRGGNSRLLGSILSKPTKNQFTVANNLLNDGGHWSNDSSQFSPSFYSFKSCWLWVEWLREIQLKLADAFHLLRSSHALRCSAGVLTFFRLTLYNQYSRDYITLSYVFSILSVCCVRLFV
jgi:hypothetical protein